MGKAKTKERWDASVIQGESFGNVVISKTVYDREKNRKLSSFFTFLK